MNINRNLLLILLTTILLVSCASVKNSSNKKNNVAEFSPPIDTIFFDFEPILPNLEYQIFRATKNGKSGWMNIYGEWIISPEYDTEFIRNWSEGVNICRKGGKYGAVNYKNEVVLPFWYSNPPSDCSGGLILVKDNLNKEAYFSKQGVKMTDFENRQPEFRNGFAIISTHAKEFARYPRLDLEDSNRTSQLYKSDFVVINTQFDTLLQFLNVPFLLEFGTLKNNRRTFFLYPYIGLHADLGISYGQYGYLDEMGEIAIEPRFRASDVFIPINGVTRNPDCPFSSNLSMVRQLEQYYYIDTLGNKVFELKTDRERIYDVSHFNDYGIGGYRTFGKNPNSSMIHLIDTTGAILHEASENDAPMSYVGGNIGNQPHNDLIPIYDKVNGFHRIYTPNFEPFAALSLQDSLKSIRYIYKGLIGANLHDQFVIIQHMKTKNSDYYYGNHQRLIDKNSQARSSWLPYNSILSNTYGNFSLLDSSNMTNCLYDFKKNELFKCDSCYFDYDNKMRFQGIYKVRLISGKWIYVNYQGKVLSKLFDTMEENIYDLSDQVKNYNVYYNSQIIAKEDEFIRFFNESIMYKRIIK
ncbi:MAG: hypothetical protein RLZ33_2004 [Bacteroidota bacterium]|jgi:hypothetical protein